MTTLQNEILINAPVGKIWEAFSIIDHLDHFDPTVKKYTAATTNKNGISAKRKVDMLDEKTGLKKK